MNNKRITINPLSIIRVLAVLAIIFIILSVSGQVTKYTGNGHGFSVLKNFNIDSEMNIPTFFSMFILLFASFLLLVISNLEKDRNTSFISKWTVLSFGFLVMSMDEMLSYHERLVEPMQKIVGTSLLGFFYYSWVIVAIILIVFLFIYFLRFFLSLPKKTRIAFFVSAAVYLGAAVGLEGVEGIYVEAHERDLVYTLIANFEEGCEMAGIIIFNWALLTYIAGNHKEFVLQFGNEKSENKFDENSN